MSLVGPRPPLTSEVALYEIGAMTLAVFRDVYRCPADANISLSLHMDAWE